MSTLQDQIDARKQRIKELRLKRHSTAAESEHHGEHEHKRSKKEHIKLSSDTQRPTASDAPLKGAANFTVVTRSGALDGRDYGNHKNSDDEGVIQSEEHTSDEGQAKRSEITDVMKAKVREDLQRLEKRTNDEIKRIVRRELMQDAMTKNS